MAHYAFFGATGGCANAALVLALNNGYQCTALARTPQKLTDMLLAKGVAQTKLDAQLHIVTGDALDAAAVTSALVRDGRPAATIVSGIGMPPTLTPTEAQATVCRNAVRTILGALGALQPAPAAEARPFLCVISTTGISNGPRDVPLVIAPLYYIGLAKPHADKKAMEGFVEEAGREGGPIRGWCAVRPSLLVDTAKQNGVVRVGSEEAPAVGYTIARPEVGKWIFTECIQGDAMRWNGKKPSLTY